MKDKTINQCQVIYQVLQDYIVDAELGDSVILWKNNFSDTTNKKDTQKAIDNFLLKLSSHRKVALSLLKIKDELYKRLLTDISDTGMSDGADIFPSSTPQRKDNQTEVLSKQKAPLQQVQSNNKPSEAMLIFSVLLDSLTDEIKGSTSDPRLVFKEAITELKLPNNKQLELFNFIDGQEKHLTQDYDKPDMTNILNQIYVTGCELLGPIAADDCLSRAVFRTEKLDASRRISPRSLL